MKNLVVKLATFRKTTRFLLPIIPALLLSACGNLLDLRQDLITAKSSFALVAGTVESPECPECPTIVVTLGDHAGKKIHAYRVLESPGSFEIVTSGDSRHLFAFNDLNSDFQYQPDEPAGWYELPADFKAGQRVDDLQISILPAKPDRPAMPTIGNLFNLRATTPEMIDVRLGTVTTLDDPRFEQDMAGLGMWRPLHFMKAGYAGIYFLEAYSPEKIPVLFVHGINGSPRDFTAMISHLDRTQFQPWVLYLPSGLNIQSLGDGMLGILSELHLRYNFRNMHIVAHSMGGLIARSYLGACEQAGNCRYVRSFTSLSSPFGGDSAARSGVDYAPVVMPVWKSMVPGSEFLSELFQTPIPSGVPHFMLFGYRNTNLVGTISSDGVIPLASQLRPEAQAQAAAIRGFDEDHMSILDSDSAHAYVYQLISGDGRW